jgi:hypothetical protein
MRGWTQLTFAEEEGPFKDSCELLKDFNIATSEEDIAEARRDMFGGSHR